MKNKARVPIITQILLLCFLALIVWAINLYFHSDSPSGSDAAFYASTARNIVEGKGFLTPATAPALLTYLIPSFSSGWPSFLPHLYPLVVAGFFLIFGISDLTLAFTNGFFFILTIPLLYLLAKKIFNGQVATVSCLWYIFTPSLLSYSGWGVSESLFIFLITLGFFLIFRLNCFFCAGLVFGLTCLTKFQGLLFIPLLLIYLYKTAKKRLSLFSFLGGLVLIFALKKLFFPPLSVDYASFKNHFLWTTIAQGAFFPSSQIGRSLNQTTVIQVFSNLNFVFKKVFANLYYFEQKIFNLALPSITVLYILSFFQARQEKKAKYFKFLSLGLILVFLAFHLLTFFDFRYLHPLLPLVIIIAAETFLSFLKKFNPKRVVPLTAIFTFLFVIIPCFTSPFWGSSIQRSLARPRKPTFSAILGKIAQENTPTEAIIVSEFPNVVAWQGNRRAIQLPLSLADLKRIDQEFVPIDAIFLSDHEIRPRLGSEWEELINNPHDFGNFYFAKSFEIKAEENYYRIPVRAVLYLKKSESLIP